MTKLRVIHRWNGQAWQRVRMRDLRKGDLFTIKDEDPGCDEHLKGVWLAETDGRDSRPGDDDVLGKPHAPDQGYVEATSGQSDPSRTVTP